MKKGRILAGVFFLSAAYLAACSQDSGGGSTGRGGSGGSTISAGGSGGSGSGGTSAKGGSGGNGSGGSGSGGTSASGGSGGNGSGGNGSGGSGSGGASAKGGSGGNGSGGNSAGGAGGTTVRGTGGEWATGGVTGRGGASTGGSGGSGGSGTGGSGTAGVPGTGGEWATGGVTGRGGASTGGSGGTGGSTGGLPALTVNGTKLQDPNGKTIILRGSSLIDIGALYAFNSNSVKGITDRMDKLAAAGVQGHVVRFPVYPKIDYNGGSSYCSPLPYPVGGTGSGANCTPATTGTLNAADYVSKVLKPAVDYATTKNLYVIIDHHQIDDATTGNSAADATTFWTDIAPKFASYSNVIYEAFNEPIDGSKTWADLKPKVQTWVDAIRAGAPNNIIIVPSNSYCQRPGDAASSPPTGTNLMYTAHIYPGNWNSTFKTQVATAVTKAPVFITEWGYILNRSDSVVGTSSATWGTDLQTLVDGNGASWTAWVTDNGWTPNMFSDSAFTKLTDFGTLVKNWLAAKANSDWVQ